MTRRASAVLFVLAVGLPAVLLCQAHAGSAGIRYALLIGCSQYRKTEFKALPYTGNDVLGFRDALRATGFDDDHIAVLHDGAGERRYLPEKVKILQELDLLLDGMRPEDTLVVALSGHGLQYKGDPVSYFAPVDGRVEDKGSLIALTGKGGLYERLKACKARQKVLIVNACRNDPAAGLDFASQRVELADVDRDEVPEGIAAIYSCAAGQKSYYDPDRKIALFYEHLIRAWKGEYSKGEPVTLDTVFAQVRDKTKTDAIRRLEARQVPVIQREFKGDWLIAAAAKADNPKGPGTRPQSPGIGLLLGGLSAATKPPAEPANFPPTKPAGPEGPLIAEMKFVHIPRGTFWTGWDSARRQSTPAVIDHDFELAAYCVTQGQWTAVMGSNPSWFCRPLRFVGDGHVAGGGCEKITDVPDAKLKRFPVENVSWNEVQAFVKKLNAQEKRKGWEYRLPTEAEWEYACRNAATTKEECSFDFYFDKGTNALSSTQANFNGAWPAGGAPKGPYLQRPTVVGSYPPNKLGLYDMHGNVSQWCMAAASRGSSWDGMGTQYNGAAHRFSITPSLRYSSLGFRLARVPSGAAD